MSTGRIIGSTSRSISSRISYWVARSSRPTTEALGDAEDRGGGGVTAPVQATTRSKAPVVPAIFRFGISRGGIGFDIRLAAVGFIRRGGKLARRRIGRPLGGQQRSDLRKRVPYVPLADFVVVAPRHQIEMNMVLVIPIGAGPKHR